MTFPLESPKLVDQKTGDQFLLNKAEILIGRVSKEGEGEILDISISDPLVSRKHAIINADKQGYYIRNFGRNGTFVNGKEVPISYLNPGDEIRVGNSYFRFVVEEEKTIPQRLALIVDMDIYCIKNIENILTEEKYECTVADTGSKAIEELLSKQFSLVIADVFTPEIDGFELCRFIKSHFDMNKLIIILSNVPEAVHEFQRCANYYLSKPIAPDKLRECLKDVRKTHLRFHHLS